MEKFLRFLNNLRNIFIVLLIAFLPSAAIAAETQQLVLVLLPHNYKYNIYARLWTFQEGSNGHWKAGLKNIPVTIGKRGTTRHKVEGDNRTPIGAFAIATSFGFSKQSFNAHFPYRQIHQDTVAVDDIQSRYYNQIVDRNAIAQKDWKSAEQMHEIPLYEWGLVIDYNPINIPKQGSNIFMHIWRDPHSPTAGCIAMSKINLLTLIRWLDVSKHPVLVIRSSNMT